MRAGLRARQVVNLVNGSTLVFERLADGGYTDKPLRWPGPRPIGSVAETR